jgi:mannan endo-1,4-beta-mannosidase
MPTPPRSAASEHDDTKPAQISRQTKVSPTFILNDQPFCFSGTNNYYLTYKPEPMVLSVLETAQKMGLSVIRTWAFMDRGSLDGAVLNVHEPGHHDGIFFHYWDPEKGAPSYNDGPTGLEKLDFVLHHARRLNLKVILPLTNNWQDFGGMDQYLLWFGLPHHHLFFQDPRARQAYRNWAEHLISRINTIDGMPYRDDPAIFAWELANEPRTKSGKAFDTNSGWDSTTIVNWADEMSTFIKSLDPNHLVSVGDEGFLNRSGSDWTHQAEAGVDHEALTSLSNVDFGTFHLYPDHWNKTQQWGIDWIETHLEIGRALGKPMVLEEYGLKVQRPHERGAISGGESRRTVGYTNYNNAMRERGGAGSLFWLLAGLDADQKRYPDYDGFSIYQGESGYSLLSDFAKSFPANAQACQSHRQSGKLNGAGDESNFVKTKRL